MGRKREGEIVRDGKRDREGGGKRMGSKMRDGGREIEGERATERAGGKREGKRQKY